MGDTIQGKLFVTVLQAQNLKIKEDKKTAAEEIVGAFLDPFSSPIFQSIEKIQNFSKTNVLPIFTAAANNISNLGSGSSDIPQQQQQQQQQEINNNIGIVCTIDTEGQEFKTVPSPEVTEPKWLNQSHSFNIMHPCALIKFMVSLNSEKESFLIGGSIINLLDEPHLWEQKPFAKWINLTKKQKQNKDNLATSSDQNNNSSGDQDNNHNNNQLNNSSSGINNEDKINDIIKERTPSSFSNEYDQFSDEDEVVGRIEVQFQYKYRRIWDPIYCGKILLLENKYQEAVEQFKEAIQIYPQDPFLYSLMVDCYFGLKQFKPAIENNLLFIKYDRGIEGLIKMAQVLMEMNELEKIQGLIDKAFKISPGNAKVKYCQLQFNHTVEVDKVNKAIEQGYDEFKKEDYASAAQSFGRALEYNSNSVILYQLRALSHLAARNQNMASQDINKILEIDHNWSKNNPTQCGYMLKDGQINVMAKKRWFTLKSYFLFYYVDQNDLAPQGMICLVDFGCAPKPGQKIKFQLQTKERTYNFKVMDDPAAFDKWVLSLGKMCKVNSVQLPPIEEAKSSIIWKNVYNKKEKTTFMLPDVMMLPEQFFVESGRFALTFGDKIISKLTSINLSECQMTGFLYKMGQLNKEWKKRFFFIQGTNLYYATVKESEIEKGLESVSPTGSLPLERSKIDQSPHSTNKANSFEVISAFRRNILLAADNNDDKEKWIKAIAIASGMQIIEKEEVDEEKKVLPSSSTLLKNRRQIRSLRSVPVVVVQQQKTKKNNDNDDEGGYSESDDDNNNKDNNNNNNNQFDNDNGGSFIGNLESNNRNFNNDNNSGNGDNSYNNNNNNNNDYSDQLAEMTSAPTRKKKQVQNKKITENDISSTENKYFSKFHLPTTNNIQPPTIVSKSKNREISSSSSSVNNSSSNNNNNNYSNNNNKNSNDINTDGEPTVESLESILGEEVQINSKHSINNDNPNGRNNYDEEDEIGSEGKPLIKKKKKSNDGSGDDNDERCCKCSIQ